MQPGVNYLLLLDSLLVEEEATAGALNKAEG